MLMAIVKNTRGDVSDTEMGGGGREGSVGFWHIHVSL